MTNADKFKEVFGVEPLTNARTTYICPPVDVRKYEHCGSSRCVDCKEWWDEEYVAPNKEEAE